jgi:hypothetical protein
LPFERIRITRIIRIVQGSRLHLALASKFQGSRELCTRKNIAGQNEDKCQNNQITEKLKMSGVAKWQNRIRDGKGKAGMGVSTYGLSFLFCFLQRRSHGFRAVWGLSTILTSMPATTSIVLF